MGVVSDKIAQPSATPYKREILRRRRRLLILIMRIMIIIIIMGDARGRDKVVANPGFGDRLRVACGVRPCVRVSKPRAIDGTVRGPRSMAPCVARDRSQESPGDSPGSLPETLLERLPETLRRLSRGLSR